MKLPVLGTAILLLATGALAEGVRNPLVDGETWADLRGDVVGDAEIRDGTELLSFDAPYRAHDPAIVPVHLQQDPLSTDRVETLTLIVDENPAPVAATFTLGEGMGHLDFEARLRVNAYSNVRAIAKTTGGDTFMVGRFVKASGGCSAPAGKDPEVAAATMGQMRFRDLSPQGQAATTRRHAKLQVLHPNFSGLQRDQLSLLLIPAHFISELEVMQGDELLFRMEGGISIAENPTFEFRYTDNGAETIQVRAVDTDGNSWQQSFAKSTVEG